VASVADGQRHPWARLGLKLLAQEEGQMQSRGTIRSGALGWSDPYPSSLEGRMSAAVSFGANALEGFGFEETSQDESDRQMAAVARKQRSLHYGALLMGCFVLVLRRAAETSGSQAGFKDALTSLLNSALDSAEAEDRPPGRRLALSMNHLGRALSVFFDRQAGDKQAGGTAFEARLLHALGEASAAVAQLHGVQMADAQS
jgi:hypothetical protein